MISLKPIFLWKYLKLTKNDIPSNTMRLFYLSWEDALWDILDKKKVEKGSVVLVPEFFCGDVEINIRAHGYKVEYYPVNNLLITTESELIASLKKYNPAVVVLLHTVGITNRLIHQTNWIYKVKKDFILIEDSVHRVVDPSMINFIKSNHFIIDSLRKVVPLQGSVVYGSKKDLYFSEPPYYQSYFYSLKVVLLWMLMNFFWVVTQIFQKTKISEFTTKIALLFMKIGYDLIGNNNKSARGFFIFNLLQNYLDIEKIKKIKKNQVETYEKELSGLSEKNFIKIPYDTKDKGELMAIPLVLSIESADRVKNSLQSKGLMLNFELNDNQWSKKQKIIYLPLGLHVKNEYIKYISNKIKSI